MSSIPVKGEGCSWKVCLYWGMRLKKMDLLFPACLKLLVWEVFEYKINCLNKKKKKFSTRSCQVEKSEEIWKSHSKDKNQLVIIQVYSTHLRFLCISKHRNQLGQYKPHCGHYAKPFGIAKLSFCRAEISLVLSQEFSKLHFKECF